MSLNHKTSLTLSSGTELFKLQGSEAAKPDITEICDVESEKVEKYKN